jgi:ATP-dependent RNA helicase RhlE
MPADIRELADAILRQPVLVQVAAPSQVADTVEQSLYFVEKRDKPAMLQAFFASNAVARALVFTRTKHGADRVARGLSRAGIRAEAIHGNKSQNARTRAISRFKSSAPPVLVATDIAARGLDIEDISHVINYEMPNVPETYVHRIGRTGRAGASGLAVSFCDSQERSCLKDIERLIRKSIPVRCDNPVFPDVDSRPQRSNVLHDRRSRNRASGGQHSAGPSASPAACGDPSRDAPANDSPRGRPVGVGYRSRGRRRSRRRI